MDLNYLFLRQQVERTRADDAVCEEARIAHEQLARCYEAQINEATGADFQFRDRVDEHRPDEGDRKGSYRFDSSRA